MLPANQSGRGKVRNQVVLSRAWKAKGRESPFFKITTQTLTFTKCDDEPRSRHFTGYAMSMKNLEELLATLSQSR